MAFQDLAFFFYHGAREALDIRGGTPHSQDFSAIKDSRQGEPYVFATDFAASDFKVFEIERPDNPDADAIDTIIISGHNWTDADINVFTGPTFVDLLPTNPVTEAAGVPIFRSFPAQDVAGGHENLRLDLLDGSAPGSVVPECTEIFFTTKRTLIRGPDPGWDHPWVRSQQQFTNAGGVTSTWLNGAARKRFVLTWHALGDVDRQTLFDLQEQTDDWSEPFWFLPPDDIYPAMLMQLERDGAWQQDGDNPLGNGTTDEVTLPLIEVLG